MNLSADELAVLLRQAKAEAHRDAAQLVRSLTVSDRSGPDVQDIVAGMLETAVLRADRPPMRKFVPKGMEILRDDYNGPELA